jgi:glycosyltransferase involved in cell wall biosynthesis
MSNRLKLVYCIPGLYAATGMERVMTVKANYFVEKMGYEVYIVLTEGKDKPCHFPLSPKVQLIHLDINFDRMHTRHGLLRRIVTYPYYEFLYKKRLKKVLFEIRPDITVSLLRREINFITSINDGSFKVGEIHFNRDNYRQFTSSIIPRPICQLITKLWAKQLIRKVRQLDKFVVLTHEDEKKWPELSNLACIHNPISFDAQSSPARCENPIAMAVGRYTYQKGFDLLLRAWKIVSENHSDWKLIVFGEGDRSFYLQLADDLSLSSDCCELNGVTIDVASQLENASVFVLSSRYEGMPMILGEAMISGVPPVAFACPSGPKDMIRNGEDGFLVENGNVEQLAEKISYLIEHESIRKSMGCQARANIKRFQIENIAHKWDLLFKGLGHENFAN